VRVGLRDAHRSARGEPPVALEACLAVGCAGVRGIVAARQAESRRTLGGGIEPQSDLRTLVPRPCAGRQALEAWGRAPSTLPRVVATPGRTQPEAPRRWHGQRVCRPVEVAYSDGRIAPAARRVVVGHARHLGQPQPQTSAAAPVPAAQAVAAHGRPVQTRWFACLPDAEAAMAEVRDHRVATRDRRGL